MYTYIYAIQKTKPEVLYSLCVVHFNKCIFYILLFILYLSINLVFEIIKKLIVISIPYYINVLKTK